MNVSPDTSQISSPGLLTGKPCDIREQFHCRMRHMIRITITFIIQNIGEIEKGLIHVLKCPTYL